MNKRWRIIAVLFFLAIAAAGVAARRTALAAGVPAPAMSQAPRAAGAEPALPQFPGAIICVDPGHPSETNPGRAVQNGTTELDINWQVAQQLKAELKKHGITVIMTRDQKDKTVTNRERAEIANKSGAALFLRLHCDTQSGRATRRGYTLYHPDAQGAKYGVTGPPRHIITHSKDSADAIHTGMQRVLDAALPDNGIKGESKTYIGAKQGALTGSIFAQVPAVTVEMVYLSHADDAAFIKSSRGQGLMARSLCAGVVEFLSAGQ